MAIRRYTSMPLRVNIVDTTGGFACAIVSPIAGASLSVGAAVTVGITTSLPATSVDFRVDGVSVGAATGSGTSWSYSWTPTSGNVGSPVLSAMAVSAAFLVTTSPGVAVAVSSPTGDFGSNFTGVLHYLRSDLGITQSSGNVSAWAAQVGPSVTPGTSAAQIGTVGTGLNGKASIISNSATHYGQYTLARPAPATTPSFFWLVWRLLSAPSAGFNTIFTDQNSTTCVYTDTGATNLKAPGGLAVTGPVNVWGRTEVAYTGGSSNSLRFGTPAKVSGDIGVTPASNSLRGIFATNLGGNKVNAELLAFITLDNVPTSGQLAAADAMVTAFYGSGNVQI